MTFNKATYDRLKWWAQIGLPGIATLYSTISGLFGLPDVTQVVGSLAAVDTFLGLFLAQSSRNYVIPTQGQILVDKTGSGGNTTLVMGFNETDRDKLVSQVASSKTVTFDVVHAKPEPEPLRQVYPTPDNPSS
jgi:Putative phage holin Dp-1